MVRKGANMSALLKDKNHSGRVIDFGQLKTENAEIAKALRKRPNYSPKYIKHCMRVADELEHCSQWRKYKVDRNGNKRLFDTRYCKQSLCRVCERVRYNHQSAKLYNITQELGDDAKYLFITLTAKNVPYSSVRKGVDEMNYALSKMLKYKAIKPYVYGGAKSLETTLGKDNKCHLHIHVLLNVKPTFYNGKARLNHGQWSKLWTRALKTEYTANINIKRPKSVSDIHALTNYIVKVDKKSDEINWNDPRQVSYMIDIADEMHRKHTLTLLGNFKRADQIANYKYNHKKDYKSKNMIDTGKHNTYASREEFGYESAKIETYTCFKSGNKLDYKLKE